MIVLGRKRAAARKVILSLGGASAMVRPASTIEHANAMIATQAAIRLREGGIAFAETYGVDPEASGALDDAQAGAGLTELIFVAELGQACIESWDGIVDEDGAAVPVGKAAIVQLCLDPVVFQFLKQAMTASYFETEQTAKKSPPSSPGATAAGASPIAADAASAASHAPPDGPDITGNIVPNMNTRPPILSPIG